MSLFHFNLTSDGGAAKRLCSLDYPTFHDAEQDGLRLARAIAGKAEKDRTPGAYLEIRDATGTVLVIFPLKAFVTALPAVADVGTHTGAETTRAA